MHRIDRPPVSWFLLAFAAIATVLVYWVGLSGPFVLDDQGNLYAIPDWLDGRLGLDTLLFERGAGMFGRPLAMGTLAFNAWAGGYSPFAFKLGNLLVHLAIGATIFGFLRALLKHDPLLHTRAALVAALIASLWLLHPLHASTVLYAVQRMAQLSTLMVLLGVWLYLALRERLQRGPSVPAAVGLLMGVPAMTVLAFLGKENGILLPLLCAVLELVWFRGPRPRPVRIFHGLFVLLPALAAIAAIAVVPERIVGGFAGREFTLVERLLSQGRVLCDYLWKLGVPNPPRMGVYADDFPVSTSLLSPPTTLIAFLVLFAISGVAWRSRKRLPAVCFGWFFFLAAHSLEAGIIPLELYFEHRNYLPSVGALLVLVVLAITVGDKLATLGIRTGRIGIVLVLGVLAVLALGAHGRARVWRSDVLIAESSLLAHPFSLRANVAVMTAAIRHGDRKRANEALERLLVSPQPRHRSLAHSYRLLVECELDHRGRPEDLEAFTTQTPIPLTLAELQPFELIYQVTRKRACHPLTDLDFGHALVELADRAATHGNRSGDHLRLRYQAASFLVRSRAWKAALPQARSAWHPGAKPFIAAPLVLAQLNSRDHVGAEKTLREAELRAEPSNAEDQMNLRWLRRQIESAKAGKAQNSATTTAGRFGANMPVSSKPTPDTAPP